MDCPNCNQKLDELSYDDQTILHCSVCGGSFFEENGINRINLKSAVELASKKIEDSISGNQKFCPKDHAVLFPIKDNDSIPQNVTLLQCPSCQGVFTYPDDLVNFKRAQNAKIQYFKLWSKPVPSLKAVLVLTFIFAFSFITFLSFNTIGRRTAPPTRAEDIVKNIDTFTSGRNVVVSFRTPVPTRSEITVFDNTTGSVSTRDVSKELRTLHFITLSDLALENELSYKITVFDERGRKVETEEKKLETRN